jgi:hypothetical protein
MDDRSRPVPADATGSGERVVVRPSRGTPVPARVLRAAEARVAPLHADQGVRRLMQDLVRLDERRTHPQDCDLLESTPTEGGAVAPVVDLDEYRDRRARQWPGRPTSGAS